VRLSPPPPPPVPRPGAAVSSSARLYRLPVPLLRSSRPPRARSWASSSTASTSLAWELRQTPWVSLTPAVAAREGARPPVAEAALAPASFIQAGKAEG
jgi:hypothetical protein